MKRVLPPVILF